MFFLFKDWKLCLKTSILITWPAIILANIDYIKKNNPEKHKDWSIHVTCCKRITLVMEWYDIISFCSHLKKNTKKTPKKPPKKQNKLTIKPKTHTQKKQQTKNKKPRQLPCFDYTLCLKSRKLYFSVIFI